MSKAQCRMSTEWDIVPLYLCGFLENRFSGHSTFVLSVAINMCLIVILQVAALNSERFLQVNIHAPYNVLVFYYCNCSEDVSLLLLCLRFQHYLSSFCVHTW